MREGGRMVHLADGVLLLSIQRLKGERSERSLFHVLNGKRSATTLQDAFFMTLNRFSDCSLIRNMIMRSC